MTVFAVAICIVSAVFVTPKPVDSDASSILDGWLRRIDAGNAPQACVSARSIIFNKIASFNKFQGCVDLKHAIGAHANA